jgi:hypothetical protein
LIELKNNGIKQTMQGKFLERHGIFATIQRLTPVGGVSSASNPATAGSSLACGTV